MSAYTESTAGTRSDPEDRQVTLLSHRDDLRERGAVFPSCGLFVDDPRGLAVHGVALHEVDVVCELPVSAALEDRDVHLVDGQPQGDALCFGACGYFDQLHHLTASIRRSVCSCA